MIENIDKTLKIAGLIFILYGIALYLLSPPEVKTGFLLNVIFYTLDFVWFVLSGAFLFYAGLKVRKGEDVDASLLLLSGCFIVFSLFTLVMSLMFNALTEPLVYSAGRVFTFLLQALSRLFSLSPSLDFLVSLIWLAVLVLALLWFKGDGMNMLLNKKKG